MAAPADEPAVLLREDGPVGRITLNRPRALNALTHPMLTRVDEALTDWEQDDRVAAVVIDGAGGRGLCAGADIRAIREDAMAGGSATRAFWRAEYRLNARVARYPKPYVALMDGIVMGGGIGLSAHGGVRVVTERSALAMPEAAIGLAPDVGGSRLLALAPGELGTHLALTAGRFGAGDALSCGFADHFVPAARWEDFTALLAADGPAAALHVFAEQAPESELAVHREWIDACYRAGTVEEIVERLTAVGEPAAKAAAERILGMSPTALKVTLLALRRARGHTSLEEVLEQEYRLSCAALAAPDLVEGIRAKVVDKDGSPRWSPASLAAVSDFDVERHFDPVGDGWSLSCAG